MDPSRHVECGDFLLFQANLKLMRDMDDKIIHTLNTKLPTVSFVKEGVNPTSTCEELYKDLLSTHGQREGVIKGCITFTANRVKQLAGEIEKSEDSPKVIRQLRKEQTQLRMLQAELNVEEVVRARSLKVLNERCRAFYIP